MRSVHARAVGVALLTFVVCAAPDLAKATGEPQITAAGIDASDRLFATWQLAPGTTFESIEFSSTSILAQFGGPFFVGDNEVGFGCEPPSCEARPTRTRFRESLPSARDRRYFVKVNANTDHDVALSPTWVIDETKPHIPGEGLPPRTATNTPVLGRAFIPPAPETIPAPVVSLLPPPKTIGAIMRRGIRARVTCRTFECYADMGLEFGQTELIHDDRTLRPGERHTFVLRPMADRSSGLRRRSRARLRFAAVILQPGAKTTQLSRSIAVRR